MKRVIYPLLNCFYEVFCRILYKAKKGTHNKYYLSAVLIFRDEAPFLREWIEYHLMLGVEHFYFYQNNSTDAYMSVINPYLKRGLITLIEWPEYPGQYSAYMDWYKRYRFDSHWATFIDADEFLCLQKDAKMSDYLAKMERYPVILVYWKLFGTNGQLNHDYNRPVIEQYVHCRPKLYTEGKIIYNTKFNIAEDFLSMHGINVKWKRISIPMVNSFGRFVIWGFHFVNRRKEVGLQLNHYWARSYEGWKAKYEKGSIEKGTKWKDYNFFERLEIECTSCDYTIYRYLVKLKLRLANDNMQYQPHEHMNENITSP